MKLLLIVNLVLVVLCEQEVYTAEKREPGWFIDKSLAVNVLLPPWDKTELHLITKKTFEDLLSGQLLICFDSLYRQRLKMNEMLTQVNTTLSAKLSHASMALVNRKEQYIQAIRKTSENFKLPAKTIFGMEYIADVIGRYNETGVSMALRALHVLQNVQNISEDELKSFVEAMKNQVSDKSAGFCSRMIKLSMEIVKSMGQALGQLVECQSSTLKAINESVSKIEAIVGPAVDKVEFSVVSTLYCFSGKSCEAVWQETIHSISEVEAVLQAKEVDIIEEEFLKIRTDARICFRRVERDAQNKRIELIDRVKSCLVFKDV